MIGTIHWNYPSGSTFIMLDGGNSKCNYPVCRVRGCECRYALGLDPPRYSVPAIVMDYSPQHLVDMRSMRMAAISYAGY